MKHFFDQATGMKNGAGFPVFKIGDDGAKVKIWVAAFDVTEKDDTAIEVATFEYFPAKRQFRLYTLPGGFFGYRFVESTSGATCTPQESVYGPTANIIFDNEKNAKGYIAENIAKYSANPKWTKI